MSIPNLYFLVKRRRAENVLLRNKLNQLNHLMICLYLPFYLEFKFLPFFVKIHNVLCIVVGLFNSYFIRSKLLEVITCKVHFVVKNVQIVLILVVTTGRYSYARVPWFLAVSMGKAEQLLKFIVSRRNSKKVNFTRRSRGDHDGLGSLTKRGDFL